MSRYNEGPKIPCPACGGEGFSPKPTVPQVCISGGGAATSPWPIKIKGMPHRVTDSKDQVAVMRDDVIFHNKAQQDEYMNRHGLARYCDGEDPAITDSQHTVFHQGDTPAPTAYAADLAKSSFFIEADQLQPLL